MDKDEVFLKIAADLAQLGTCDRARVGAVITRQGRCISWGYNGAPPGLPHCSENHHGWDDRQPSGVDKDVMWEAGEQERWAEYMAREQGCRNATHAEANALAFAARQGISTDGGTLYVSQSPCLDCARLLIAAGIVRVVWDVEYRDHAGLNLLAEANIELL